MPATGELMHQRQPDQQQPADEPAREPSDSQAGYPPVEDELLSPSERALLTPDVVARWTGGLGPDDHIASTEIVRLERGRRRTLETIRQGAELTDMEFRLVRYLQRHEGKVRTYVQLANALWGTTDHPITARMLRAYDIGSYAIPMIQGIQNYVSVIRRKLEIDPLRPQHLATVRGVGYIFYADPPALDDGINYAARATEHGRYREAMEAELGITEDVHGVRVMVDEPAVSRRLGLGPAHPDYHAVEADVTERQSERRP
jgi:hypothetical protein